MDKAQCAALRPIGKAMCMVNSSIASLIMSLVWNHIAAGAGPVKKATRSGCGPAAGGRFGPLL
jgi:hypothetical protein